MVNKIQKKVVKHLKKGKLNKIIKKKQKEIEILDKLIFIRLLYKGKTVEKASELMDISLSTGHRWLDRWNEDACNGLYNNYSNGGRKAKLTDEQFQLLDEMMYEEQYLTTRKVHKMIKDEFNIDYSLKQVREIVHKLGYSYKKGNMIYSKMPDDAEEILKKKMKKFGLSKDLIGLVDQVACQNLSNSPTNIYKTKEKAIHPQNPDRFSITGIGFQGINANSFMTTAENSQIQEMIKFFINVRMINCKNENTIKELEKILNCEKITDEAIIKVLEEESLPVNKFKTKIEKQMKNTDDKTKLMGKLQRGLNKEKSDDKRKIGARKRKILLELLNPYESILTQEKRIVIILDNYSVHKSKILEEACSLLNIILVFLPPYSPKLNPIEQVWRTIKKELSSEFIKSEEFLINNFKRIFYEIVDNASFTKNWIRKFLKEGRNEVDMELMCSSAELKEF